MTGTELTLRLPPDLAEQLQALAGASNHAVEDVALAQLRAALTVGQPGLLRQTARADKQT